MFDTKCNTWNFLNRNEQKMFNIRKNQNYEKGGFGQR